MVISILYISASKHRLLYSFYTLVLVAVLPWIVDKVVQGPFALPPKLQPTLFVWTLITIFAEFLPREREGESADRLIGLSDDAFRRQVLAEHALIIFGDQRARFRRTC